MYTVRDGDTLASIASSLWGDSSLWYKIAELNGLTADSALPTGMPLLIPVGVVRSTNNATTYKPYDPAEVVGNTMPTAVKPPKSKHNCGVLGQIVLVVIAAVVAFYTAGAAAQFFAGAMAGADATAAGAIATGLATAETMTGASLATLGAAAGGAAVGGAVGSVVSQVVGVATGIQDKFSWNAVGLAAIGAAAGVGTAKVIPGTSNFAAAERGMANSAITQGIGVATGMQSKFSWAAVAAAGIGSAAGNEFRHDFGSGIADALGARSTDAVVAKSAQYATSGIVAMVDAIAGAGARTLIEGTDFGDNVLAALPDAIGSTIGNALAQGIKAQFEPQIEVAEVTPDHIDQLDFGPPIDIASLVPKLDLTQFNRTMAAITARQRNATDLPIWARHDIFQNWSLFEASTNSASPTPNVRSDNFHAGDTSLFGHEGPFATYFHRLDQTASTLRQADLALTAADSALEAGDWPAFALNEAHGVLLTLGGFGQASTWPLTGSLDALGQSLGHSPARAEYDLDFVVGTSMAMWSATSLAAAPGRIPIAGDSDFIGPVKPSNWDALTSYPDAHAFSVHGGDVTDANLITRSRTGLKPNGEMGPIPRFSSAFYSDELLISTDQMIRQGGALQNAIARQPGETVVRVETQDVGDLGIDLGYGYARIAPTGNKALNQSIFGPSQRVDGFRSAQGIYELHAGAGVWQTITVYPAPH
ncbi:MAG: LysM domain-containing protein [Terricaulis sp.]